MYRDNWDFLYRIQKEHQRDPIPEAERSRLISSGAENKAFSFVCTTNPVDWTPYDGFGIQRAQAIWNRFW